MAKKVIILFIFLFALTLSGCTNQEEAVKVTDLIKEQIVEGERESESGQMISYSYHLPFLTPDDADSHKWNAMLQKIVDSAQNEESEFTSVQWDAYLNGDLLSIVLQTNYLLNEKVTTFNYNFKSQKALNNKELCAYLKCSLADTDRLLKEKALRKFDADCLKNPTPYSDLSYRISLRAETLAYAAIDTGDVPLYLNAENTLCAFAKIATAAQNGIYNAALVLKDDVYTIEKEAECDFVKAMLKDNQVTLTFQNSGLAGMYLPKDSVEFNKPYQVKGLYGNYHDLTLGYLGNGGYIYLFLTDENGAVSFCNVNTCLESGPDFLIMGPFNLPQAITSYKKIAGEDGMDILAIGQDATEFNLAAYVEEAETFLAPALNNGWSTEDGKYEILINGDAEPILTLTSVNDGQKIAASLLFGYLGLDEEGLHFQYVLTTGDKVASGQVILSQEFDAQGLKSDLLTLKQTKRQPLEGLNDLSLIFYPAHFD